MSIKLPKIIKVADYHEFDGLNDTLRGTGIRVYEVGFTGCDYEGVIYAGKRTAPKVQKLVNDIKRRMALYDRDDDF